MKYSILFFLVVSIVEWINASPITGSCTDGSGVYIMADSLPCSMLLDPSAQNNDVYGIYRARVALCDAGNHECCSTCKQVYKQNAIEIADPAGCQDVADGIWLADSSYSCNYLLDQELPNSASLGIYRARVSLCRRGIHQCCHACQQVFIQEGLTEVTATTVKASTETQTSETTTIKTVVEIVTLGTADKANSAEETDPTEQAPTKQFEVIDTTEKPEADEESSECKDDSFHLLGQTFDCGLLTSPPSPAYAHRERLCSLESTLCCLTCKNIQSHITYTIKTEDKPTTDTIEPPVYISGNAGTKLAKMEKRMHDKVAELEHEVDVLFGIFRQNKK